MKNWRQPCSDYWKPDGRNQGRNCPKYHPRRQSGCCATRGSTKHYTSHKPLVKPKMKNAEYEEGATWNESTEWGESWQAYAWENAEYEMSSGKEGKGKRSKSKGKSKGKTTPRSITPRHAQNQNAWPDRPQPKPKPDARSCVPDGYQFAMLSTKSKLTLRHTTWESMDYVVCTIAQLQKKLPVSLFKPGKWNSNQHRKIALFGHNAKNMKQFTMLFQSIAQNDTLAARGLVKYGSLWTRMSRMRAMPRRKATSWTRETYI